MSAFLANIEARFTVRQLRQWAKDLQMKRYSKLRKLELADSVRRAHAAIFIYLKWKRWRHRRTDPITLSPVRSPVFYYSPARRHYTADVLLDFLTSTGDLRDPTTRAAYTAPQLERLNVLAAQMKKPTLCFPDCVDVRQSQCSQQSILDALQREGGQQVVRMLNWACLHTDTIESRRLYERLRQRFNEIMHDFVAINEEEAYIAIEQYLGFIERQDLPHADPSSLERVNVFLRRYIT